MPPQWTRPLDITDLSPQTSPLNSPTFDYEPQFQSPVHHVPTTNSIRRNPSRPVLPRLVPRLNRLHPRLPSDLSRFAAPVTSDFLRVSAAAASRYTSPPDPTDEHDHPIFQFPSPIDEPRRRNIQYLIQRYNNTHTPPNPHTPPPNRNHQPHPEFNIRSVRHIFERHTPQPPEPTDISLSSVTDSASPSDISHPRLIPKPTSHSPPAENRPRRIAFADLSNTLDLSPCPSSTSDTHPDHRNVPDPPPSPPCDRSPTLYFPDHTQHPLARKKSFAVFRHVRGHYAERVRSKSFANAGNYSSHPTRQQSARRYTNADPPKNNWLSRHARAYGGTVRRRFHSFRNMLSADDY